MNQGEKLTRGSDFHQKHPVKDEAKVHLSPVQAKHHSANGAMAPVRPSDDTAAIKCPRNDLQFYLDTTESVFNESMPPMLPEITVSSTSEYVDYQRVFIGGDDASGVSPRDVKKHMLFKNGHTLNYLQVCFETFTGANRLSLSVKNNLTRITNKRNSKALLNIKSVIQSNHIVPGTRI